MCSGEVSTPYTTKAGVHWANWKMIDKRDHFANLIVWRMPQFATQFKADRLFIDMHDLLPDTIVKTIQECSLYVQEANGIKTNIQM
jgi:hypothetical protein